MTKTANLKTEEVLFLPPYPSNGSIRGKAWWRFKVYFLTQAHNESKEVALSLLECSPDAKLLDLGCADGKLTMKLAGKVGTKKIFGIDLLKIDNDEPITMYQRDLNVPFSVPSNEFDIVCASHIIEHLNDTDNFLREIHRILKPGGYTIICTDNLASWHNAVYLILSRQPEPCMVSDEMGLSFKRFAHRRVFTIPALSKLLRYHGFKVDDAKGAAYYPLPTGIARVMAKLDKWHSRVIVIKARK